MIIGSHVSMSASKYLEGSVLEMLSYDANAMMIYSGPPQNTKRVDISKLHIQEALDLLETHHIPTDHIILHAPYLINLANTVNEDIFNLGVSLLKDEIKRANAMNVKYIVLHPGSHLKMGTEVGIAQIVRGLDQVLEDANDVIICLETMAGKGSECGKTFEEISSMISQCRYPEKLGVCLDTCHIHDAGYSLDDFDDVLEQFDTIIGLNKLHVVHLNDSMNIKGAHKDRHANIGKGQIGFKTLCKIAHHPLLANIPKILETPYIEGNAPYRHEINQIRTQIYE